MEWKVLAALISSCAAFVAQAGETGRWYDSEQRLSWGFAVENGEATISTPDFWDSNARDNCKGDIVVPSRIGPDGPGGKTTYPVRDMAPGLFRNCTKVTGVTLPDGIRRIAPNAFYFDRNSTITNISVGAGCLDICDNAFLRCEKLVSLNIPNTVTNIGANAVSLCKVLPRIDIPGSVKTISDSAFAACYALEEVSFGDGVEIIDADAFLNCGALKSADLPSSVRSIGDRAFYGCSALNSVVLREGLESIGFCAFTQCESLLSASIPESVSYVGERAFQYCPDSIFDMSAVPGVLMLSGWAVGVKDPYGEIDLSGAAGIADGLFNEQRSVTGVVLPDGLDAIGASMFRGCSSLSSVTVPPTVKSIGDYAFMGCEQLLSVVIPSGVTNIGEQAFAYCRKLDGVTLPDGLREMGDSAFDGCSALTSIKVPASLRRIPMAAFQWCTSLGEATVEEGVETIGNASFYGCTALPGFRIPDSVKIIEDIAFGECGQMLDTNTIENVSMLDGWIVGSSQPLLVSVDVPGDVRGISDNAFGYRRNLTSVVLEEGVLRVPEHMCDCATSLAEVTLPASLLEIGDFGFYNCDSLVEVFVPSNVVSLGEMAFGGCAVLETVYLPVALKGGVNETNLIDGSFQAKVVYYLPDGSLVVDPGSGDPDPESAAVFVGDLGFTSADEPVEAGLMCGVAVEWPVSATELPDAAFRVAGLPSGLKFTAKDVVDAKTKELLVPANTIYGAPTAASRLDARTGDVVPSEVKLTVMAGGRAVDTYVLRLYVAPLPPWAVGSFEGTVGTSLPDAGIATMTITAAGKVNGKLSVGGTNWTFKADSFALTSETDAVTNLAIEAVAAAGKSTVPISLRLARFETDYIPDSATALAQGTFGGTPAELCRLPWADKGDPAPARCIAPYAGAYTMMVDCGGAEGTASFAVDEKGVVKGSMILPDGTKTRKVSFSGSVHTRADSVCMTAYAPPDARKGHPAVFETRRLAPSAGPLDGEISYRDPGVLVSVAELVEGSGASGAVTMNPKYGQVAAGKVVTLTAKASPNSVFSRWVVTPPYDAGLDLSSPTIKVKAGEDGDVPVTAYFVTAEEDRANVSLAVDGTSLWKDANFPKRIQCGVALEWPVTAVTLSKAAVKVAGLPTGLKFAYNGAKGSYSVAGVPTAASKTDAKTGDVIPSVVKFTVTTAGKATVVFTLPVIVEPIPVWAVGTFDGALEGGGLIQSFAVTAGGKISGKMLSDGLAYTLSAPAFDEFKGGVFRATVVGKSGKFVVTNDVSIAEEGGRGVAVSEDGGWTAWQTLWRYEPWKTAAKPFAKAPPLTVDFGGATVTMKFSATGAVAASGKFVTGVDARTGRDVIYTANCSTVLIPSGDGQYVAHLYFPPKAGRFDGFASENSLIWNGSAFIPAE